MTSARQLAANRRNAVRSTGPRTRAGKIRSRRNALRHGLSAKLADYRLRSSEEEKLAGLIAGDSSSAFIRIYAREVALAQFDLLTVQAIRVSVLETLAVDSSLFAPSPWRSISKKGQRPDLGPYPVAKLAKAIQRLDRYEKRSFAQRQRAIRRLDAIRSAENE
jgi:hypothetical protein